MGRLTEIAPGVLVTTSTFAMTTSTVVVGSSGGCLLVDPGVTVADLAALAAELADRGLRPAVAWSTHPHWDHVLWSAGLGDAPRYIAPAAIPILETERDGMVENTLRSAPGSDLDQARAVMRQLGIEGEIGWNAAGQDSARLDFNVTRQGRVYQVQADPKESRAAVVLTEYNAWGVLRTLHTFVGVSPDDPRNRRDWFLTSLWAFTMDAVAAGVVFMVLSSFYMWWSLRDKRKAGVVALALGMAVCGLFVTGLRWLYG